MRYTKFFGVLFGVVVFLALGFQNAAAQTGTTGDLTGVVTDPTGAVMYNVKVQLRDVQQGGTREANTNEVGVYRFSLLPPGSYDISINATGFQPVTRTTTVSIGQITTLDLKLVLGATTANVVVIEEAPLVQTESGTSAATLEEKVIQNMPNQGNDMSYPLEFTPRVVENTLGGYGNYSVDGMSATANLFTIDGMDDNDPYLSLNNTGATSLMLGQMEVQEATIVTNGYGGQYGGLAGSNVNYVTKGGTNQIHGALDYYWNGRAFNAESFFAHQGGLPKAAFVNANQWGAELGGRIIKDKLFWYVHQEGIRLIIPSAPSQVVVPSSAFEAATLTNLMSSGHSLSVPFYTNIFSIYDAARSAHGTTDANSPGNPNLGSATGCDSSFPASATVPVCADHYGVSGAIPTNEMLYTWRVDYNINSNDRVWAHFQLDRGYQGTYTDPVNSLFNLVSNQPEDQGQLVEYHTFGPSATNQFIISGQWYSAFFTNANRAATLSFFPTSLGFPSSVFTALAAADATPNGRNVTQAQVSDDVTKVTGRHTLKFGVKYRRNDVTDAVYGQYDSGAMSIPDLNAFYNDGYVPAPIVTDFSTFTQAFPSSAEQRFKFWTAGGYAEDDIQVKPNLTLTLALRGDHASNPTCKNLCFSRLTTPFDELSHDPTIPYNQIVNPTNKTALLGLTNVELAPRFGFAWQPFGREHNTVIRGGVGIFWDTFPGQVVDNISENPPQYNFFTVGSSANPGLIGPKETNSLNNIAASSNQGFVSGFTSGKTVAAIEAAVPAFVPPSINFTSPFTHVPQYQKWTLEIEHGFGKDTSVTVTYAGNHGIHETVQNTGFNVYAPLATFPSGFGGLPTAPPDPRFGYAEGIFSEGISKYNGVSISATHRYATGQISASYTYSHELDNVSNGGFSPFAYQAFLATNTSPYYQADPGNLRGMYGSGDYDVRHYFALNYLWEIPFKRLTFGRGPDSVLKGWNISGTFLARSGYPWTPIDSKLTGMLDSSNYGATPVFEAGGPLAFAGFSGTPVSGSCTSVGVVSNSCINASAFLKAGTETGFGNVGRNSFRGPGYYNTDLSIWKAVKVIPHRESAELDLGFQFYNILNHANFDNPVSDINGAFGTFNHTLSPATTVYGVALGADASPRIVQLKAQFKF